MTNNVKSLRCSRTRELNLEPNFVTVKVGTDEGARSFGVHQDLICTHSPFFNSAINGDWKESKSKFVDLPEDSPKAFNMYLQWLYLRKLVIDNIGLEHPEAICQATSSEEDQAEEAKALKVQGEQEQKLLVDAYVLGDKVGDFDFADAAIDALIDSAESTWFWPATHSLAIYQRTSESSALRRFFTDLYVFVFDAGWNGTEVEELSRDALYDITKRFLQAKMERELNGKYMPWKENPCVYHHHVKTNQPCYKTKLNEK